MNMKCQPEHREGSVPRRVILESRSAGDQGSMPETSPFAKGGLRGISVPHLSQGFALLFTLVLVSVIGGIAFGVGRLALQELKQTNRFQDSQTAYQAAEAGLEYALLRYRYERNTQVPEMDRDDCTMSPGRSDPNYPTNDTPYVLRVNLTTGERRCIDPGMVLAPDPSEIVYYLKIHYLEDELGDPDDIQNSPEVKEDDVLEINGIQESGATSLKFKTNIPTPVPPGTQVAAEIQFENEMGIDTQPPKLVRPFELPRLNEGILTVETSGADSVSFKPIAGNTKLAITPENATSEIDFGFTIIDATGFAQGVKRRLALVINRKTGNTHGVFNFVTFQAQNATLGQ